MIRLFIIYSRSDEFLKNEMLGHFEPLVRKWNLKIWHDWEIKPGEKWDDSIKKEIRESEIVVPLISGDFFSSKYIHEVEMQEALRRHSNNECIVAPVIVRPCAWSADPSLQKIQALPTDGKAVASWANKDEAWENVVFGVERILQNIKVKRTQKAYIEELNEEIRRLELENKNLISELSNTAKQRQQYAGLETKLKEAEKSKRMYAATLKKDVNKLEAENQKLNAKLTQTAEQRQQYAVLEAKLTEAEKSGQMLAKTLEIKMIETEKMAQATVVLQGRVQIAETKNKKLEEELQKAKEQEERYVGLRLKLKETEKANIDLKANITQLEENILEQLIRIEDLMKSEQMHQAEFSHKVSLMEDEKRTLNVAIADKEKEIIAIKAAIKNCIEKVDSSNIPNKSFIVFGILGLPYLAIWIILMLFIELILKVKVIDRTSLIASIISASIGAVFMYYFYTSDSIWAKVGLFSLISWCLAIVALSIFLSDKLNNAEKALSTLREKK